MTCKLINRYTKTVLCGFREVFAAAVSGNLGEHVEVELFVRTRKKKERRMFSSRVWSKNDTEMEHRLFTRQSNTFSFPYLKKWGKQRI